jgi:hypothetical protein
MEEAAAQGRGMGRARGAGAWGRQVTAPEDAARPGGESAGLGGAGRRRGRAVGTGGRPARRSGAFIMALHARVFMGYEESIRGAGAPPAADADARHAAGAAVRGRRIKGP